MRSAGPSSETDRGPTGAGPWPELDPTGIVSTMTSGLRSGYVRLLPYSARLGRGRAEYRRLSSALNQWTDRVDHVGSTAVPGLAVKPVIDPCPGVQDPVHAPRRPRR